MKTTVLLLLIALSGIHCASDNQEEKTSTQPGKAEPGAAESDQQESLIPYDASKPAKGQYCYITKMYTANGNSYFDADYIQFLMGEEAVTAARKHNDAIPEVNAKGDTTWSLPDDYYIVNDNTKTRTLTLADNVEYYVVHMDGGVFLKKEKLQEVKSGIDHQFIFILTLDNNQRVTRIQQQYLP